MATINAPALSAQSLAAGLVATLSVPARGQALVQVVAGGAIVAQGVIGTGQVQRFGPYTVATTVNVRADDGAIEFTTNPPDTISWAELLAKVGTSDGQLQRVAFPGGLSFWMEWEAATSQWWPMGGEQPYYIGAVVIDTNSTGLQTLAFPTVAHPAGFFRSGLGMFASIVVETNIAATARTLQLTLGGQDIVNLPTATNRRVAIEPGFVADGASSGWCFTKKDNNEFSLPGQGNQNVTPLTLTWAGALSLTGSATFTTAVAAATATLRRFKLSLVRG
jgi:hypothetical protein